MRMYKRESILERKEQKMMISKVHFLIHPSYYKRDHRFLKSEAQDLNQFLLDHGLMKYIEKAKRLGNDELMIAFGYNPRKSIRRDIRWEAGYIALLRELKNILKSRLIILSSDFPLFKPETSRTIEMIKRLAGTRGFIFDNEVLTEAYGEYLENCVREGAVNLHRVGGFRRKTQVIPELTELNIPELDAKRRYLIKLRKNILRSEDRKHITLKT